MNARNPRQDVELIHSKHEHALHSGFTGLGAWPSAPRPTDHLQLRCVLADGSEVRLTIPEERWRVVPARRPHLDRWKIRFAHLRRYGLQAAGLVARGQLGVLREKVRRQFSEQPTTQIPGADRLIQLVRPLGREAVHFLLDHRLGGGANQYSERLIRDHLAQGDTVLILGFQITKLSLVLTIRRSESNHHFLVATEEELLATLQNIPLVEIIYNTAVSFSNPERVPELLTTLKHRNRGKVTLLVHDYFMICPSHFLLDKSGSYCGIPDPAECRHCLPVNPHGFTSLFNGDINQWRVAWKGVIEAADRIVAFSNASAALVQKAFPGSIGAGVLHVLPHKVTYLRDQTIEIDCAETLIIGIVGQIGLHKGAEVIRDLATEIRQQGGKERIAVIGTLEIKTDKTIVTESGPYCHENLADEIRRSGANLMFLPSIWPETFSYVAQELIELGLPIVCFDLGAPAERIRTYPKGFLVSSRHPKELLRELRMFFKRHYSSPSLPPS